MRRLAFCGILCMVIGCTQKGKFTATKDEQIAVQAIALPSNGSEQTFQVRLMPSQKWKEEGGTALGKKMQYDVDSCFYVVKNNVTYYPESITPIANGMATNYEYLLSFSGLPGGEAKNLTLVYHDKYMSQKDYKLLLN
jgi:hypothetical protein